MWFVGVGVIVTLSLVGVATYVSPADTYVPRPEAYEVSGDSRQVTVAFCGGNGETVSAQDLREEGQDVVVGIRLRRYEGFQQGGVHRVTFTLRAPLGDRVVRGESGTAVLRTSQFVCPG